MLSSAAGYVVPMVVNLIAIPFLLRGMGEAAYGLQALVAVIIGYLMVMDMGLELPIVKLLAEDRAKNYVDAENRMLSTTLQLYIAIGILGMIVIVIAAEWLARSVFKVPQELIPEAIWVFRIAGIGFLGSVGLSWGRALAMGLQRFEISYGVSVISNIVGVGSGLALVYAGHGVVGFVLARVVVSLATGPAYWLLASRLLPAFRIHWGIDRVTLRRVGSYVGYGAMNRVVSSLVSRLDQTLIGVWLGVAMAGIYSIPFLIVNSLGYMIAYMLGFIFPMASELQSLGQLEKLKDIYNRSTRFITALASMIFIPVLVFGDLFMTLWVGASIGEKTRYVLILLALSGYLGTLAVTLPNSIAVGTGRIKQFTIYCTIRATVLGIGCFLLIKPMGLEGAGVALLIANVVDIFFLIIVLKYYLHISPFGLFRSAYLSPLAIGFILTIITIFLRPLAHSWTGLITSIGIFELMYILISFKIGVFGETEKRVMQNYLSFLFRHCRAKKLS
jgi:O-antigen/teichoic acid export membrane protein